jgi:transposase-like protein
MRSISSVMDVSINAVTKMLEDGGENCQQPGKRGPYKKRAAWYH